MVKARWGRIEGMKEAREALQELARATQTNVGKRALKAPAAVFVRRIKAKAPVSTRPGNPTPGSLRAAVREGQSRSRRGMALQDIVADDVAAVPNEFGTSKMSPQPFFRPGVDSGRAAAAEAMAEAVKTEVDAAVQRAARKSRKA